MKPFSLLVKPVGSACNLNCKYCFYSDHPAGVMAESTLQRMVETYNALPFAAKSIALQGGEPLLSPGYVLDLVESIPVMRSLQTNATLVTPEVAARLYKGGWLVGASLDGPKWANVWRTYNGEANSHGADKAFDEAVLGIRNLEQAKVDYNLLTVVSTANVKHAREVYRFLRDNFSTRYHQYIECTSPCEVITANEWGTFLCELFDEWSINDAYSVSVRLFDSIVSKLVCGFHTQCSFASSCDGYLVVEHDGSVYPCDFHVRDDLKLGNILTHSWEEMISSDKFKRFAAAKCSAMPSQCLECKYSAFCNGDCPRNRIGASSVLCPGWKMFFKHSIERFEQIVAKLK